MRRRNCLTIIVAVGLSLGPIAPPASSIWTACTQYSDANLSRVGDSIADFYFADCIPEADSTCWECRAHNQLPSGEEQWIFCTESWDSTCADIGYYCGVCDYYDTFYDYWRAHP